MFNNRLERKMNKKEFLGEYGATKVKFWAYYKDVFIFVGNTKGEEITIWIDGYTARMHNLDIDANTNYMLLDLNSMIDDATRETREEFFQVEFMEKGK